VPQALGTFGRYANRTHAVAFAPQPAAQAAHQPQRVQPIGLGALCLPLYRNAGWVHDLYFVPRPLECPRDPESVLSRLVHDDDPDRFFQPPFVLDNIDRGHRLGQSLLGYLGADSLHRGAVVSVILKGNLPAFARQLQCHRQNRASRSRIVSVSRLHFELPIWFP
jgi:hypothetical protein